MRAGRFRVPGEGSGALRGAPAPTLGPLIGQGRPSGPRIVDTDPHTFGALPQLAPPPVGYVQLVEHALALSGCHCHVVGLTVT